MVILSNKIMQNYPKIPPKGGKGNLPWLCGNVERVITINDDTCIPIGDIRFSFIKKFYGGSFFSGQVVGIQSNDKRKCKFDEDGDIHNWTLDHLQAYSAKQTAVYNDNDK